MTFAAFVKECGLGRGYINELERGVVVPTITALHKIATVLGVSMADLVAEAGETSRREARTVVGTNVTSASPEKFAKSTSLDAEKDSAPSLNVAHATLFKVYPQDLKDRVEIRVNTDPTSVLYDPRVVRPVERRMVDSMNHTLAPEVGERFVGMLQQPGRREVSGGDIVGGR